MPVTCVTGILFLCACLSALTTAHQKDERLVLRRRFDDLVAGLLGERRDPGSVASTFRI
jgi:hypothetical protein